MLIYYWTNSRFQIHRITTHNRPHTKNTIIHLQKTKRKQPEKIAQPENKLNKNKKKTTCIHERHLRKPTAASTKS
jgi:hypothetical protein